MPQSARPNPTVVECQRQLGTYDQVRERVSSANSTLSEVQNFHLSHAQISSKQEVSERRHDLIA